MKDITKTVNHIISQPVRPFKAKLDDYKVRDVLHLNGVWAIVKSEQAPGEPIGRYNCWVEPHLYTSEVKHAKKEGIPIRAFVEFKDNAWNVIEFQVVEDKDESTAKEQGTELKEMGYNY